VDASRLTTWIEIDEGAYAHNLGFFRRLVGPRVELAAVIKANAYGHGLLEIARLAARHGADSFCVFELDEALALRRAGFDQDVLILGHTPLARLDEVVAEDFRQVLFNRRSLDALAAIVARTGRRCRLHLKLETGTHRLGVDEGRLADFLARLAASPGLELEGVYTHLANVEDTTDHRYARRQLERFEGMCERIAAAGFKRVKRHAACTAAALVVPSTHLDLVRLGIGQYGLWPSKETLLSYKLRHHLGDGAAQVLRPVLTWKARIAQLKEVAAGSYVGYGCTYQTTRRTRIAVLPVGYADGYDRRLSNQAHVLVGGRRAPVRGRVCMNLIMVDVTDVPGVALEDEAVLLGRQGEQTVSAEHLAALAGTISYEIVARLRPGIPRLVRSPTATASRPQSQIGPTTRW